MLGRQNRKRSPKWQLLKERQRKGKSPWKGNKGKIPGPEWEPQVKKKRKKKQTCLLSDGWWAGVLALMCIGQAMGWRSGGEGDKKHKKREPRWLRPLLWSQPTLTPWGCTILCCWCSVPQLCPILCDPTDCSMPVFSVFHYLPEFAQTYVHWVDNAIQPSHALSSPSSALNLSQHQSLFQWVSYCVPNKILSCNKKKQKQKNQQVIIH